MFMPIGQITRFSGGIFAITRFIFTSLFASSSSVEIEKISFDVIILN
jgi:hypothetical protein